MCLKKFIPPMSIVLLLLLALAGTYYVRLHILEKHMTAAVEMEDKAELALPGPLEHPVHHRRAAVKATQAP